MAIITVKYVDYCCINHGISKSHAIPLLKNSVFDDRLAYIKCISRRSILKAEYTTIVLTI